MIKLFTIIVSLLVSLLTGPFMAQSQAASNDSLGRLFSRPNERNNLDNLRQNQKLKTASPQDNLQPEAITDAISVVLPDPITLQGYVKRSDGAKSTLWINNQPVQEDSTLDNVQIGRLNQRGNSNKAANVKGGADSLDIKIPANGKHVRLKAGQVYEPETNQIKELKTVEKEKRLNLEETGVLGDDGNDVTVSKP
jgi:hypothetical protein